MRKIHPYSLWIGNVSDARDLRGVLNQGIAALVDLALNEPPVAVMRELGYCRLPLGDGGDNAPWLLRMAIETTAKLIAGRIPTLLSCSMGLSRSLLIAAAALTVTEGGSLDQWLRHVVEGGRGDVSATLLRDIRSALETT